MPHCLRFEMQWIDSAFFLALANPGRSIEARMAMMAMTTKSSINVKARRLAWQLSPAKAKMPRKWELSQGIGTIQPFFEDRRNDNHPIRRDKPWHGQEAPPEQIIRRDDALAANRLSELPIAANYVSLSRHGCLTDGRWFCQTA